MAKFKSLKTVFLASAITIGVSTLTSQNVIAATPTIQTYTVKSGDCLSLIAKNCGISLNDLRKANNKWNDSVFPGQVLKVSGQASSTVQQPAQLPSNAAKTYTVKSGDCLSSIAKQCGISLNNLRKVNDKWNDSIYPGQVLQLSAANNSTPQPTVQPVTQLPTNSVKTYIVKSGDCLSSIAKQCGISLNDLRKANNKWNDSISPGQVLNLTGTITSTPVQTTPVQANSGSIKYTESDLNLLSRLISAEARGESYNGQVAVGAVVVNRVKSSYFPNSISAVINQQTNGNYQFSVVKNGSINNPAHATSLKAAVAALSGSDPTNNALFFYDGVVPKALTSPQPVSVVIGNLTFVYLIK
ncbi:LysM peptidoglycan-binding domain-containing protein [Clostridium lacusfryxellense]|uniref:LysM peptidoglycan-binding domain-containing protein n=1 Tax=Clostridium lacusfryxellense TaxID=205328 RepID=UPI001C0C2EC4|nr:LysM peptidoglycan-binding domain-containing protein [Clostridium lacusfryxellense]MBU3109938.1 LysM peptidoglycan-binding domain-containing protein [Clostridium lacusfryxellense]